ncbi:uncharacterized protein A1O5_06332 [Cladophialophora psammophila CBS 110553]|uniref:Cytochrome P450 oxidoreductase n=1 Tax=Cladophialophora psammophila CBS 110553 TaxID=1182543 RepID=W9XIR7_9EURO|nr:uncharacterized protein A1O5_06332 [Cladophialophora psammophila CBS 110553]EXJ70264.1 hypothetical protein A1O5_06332 [Cladophialophora psammophila CBS 110553]
MIHAIRGDTHLWLQLLHSKVGVRFFLVIIYLFFKNSVERVHGAGSIKLAKGPWYDGNPNVKAKSMASTRSLTEHKARRRIWDPGFGPKALQSYESRVIQHTQRLSLQLERRNGQVCNMSDWCDFFAFDVMGDLVFGQDFGMLEKAEQHLYMKFLHQALRVLSIFSHTPWANPLCKYIFRYDLDRAKTHLTIVPFVPVDAETRKEGRKFMEISAQQYQNRKARGTSREDIFSYLLASDSKGVNLDDDELSADSGALIVGGSDTTAVCLTYLLYFLTKYPDTQRRLTEEIDQLWDGSPEKLNAKLFATAEYMNGAINESLRLYPPGPNGMQRTIPRGGHVIQGELVPENTQASSSIISRHRRLRNFTHADKFVPERWIDSERPADFVHDTKGFIPFSAGQYACIGKNLALAEMRLFLAEVLKKLKLELDDTFNEKVWDAACRSNLSLLKGALPVRVYRRER